MAEKATKTKAAPLPRDKRQRLAGKLEKLEAAAATVEHCAAKDVSTCQFFVRLLRERREEVVAYVERLLAAK